VNSEQLSYLRDVLGLQYIPRPKPSEPVLLVVDLKRPLQILSQNSMFIKMLAAIQLDLHNVFVVEVLPGGDWPQLPENLKVCLCFAPELEIELKDKVAFPYFICAGPRDLERDGSQKRETWTRLKAVEALLQ
jgi:hypothetical protein